MRIPLLPLAVLCLVVAACGQSGDLYLPDNKQEITAPEQVGRPAPPAEEQKEEEEEGRPAAPAGASDAAPASAPPAAP